MLQGQQVLLRAFKLEDFQRQCEFSNDVEYEVIGGGDPWEPVSVARVQAQFEERIRQGEAHFAIEADGQYIGSCGLFHFDQTAHTCELGIGIGDKAYWGVAMGATRCACCSIMPSDCAISIRSGWRCVA